MTIKSSSKNKKGMSLIGLLIGMALSAVILAGMLQIFSSMRRSSQLIKNEIELNETLLFAVQNMSKIIAQAGHIKPKTAYKFPLANELRESDAGWYAFDYNPPNQSISLANNIAWPAGGNYINPDVTGLIIRFQGDATANIRHCDGTLIPDGQNYASFYRFEYTSFPPNPPYSLVCSTYSGGSIAPITLAPGMLVKMYFRYGNDRNLDNAIDQYINTSTIYNMTPGGAFNLATKTIRVALIMRTKEPVFATAKPMQSFTLFQDMPQINFPNDKYLYKSVVFTIPLMDAPQDY